MKKISIIIPVYNREKYIQKCLDSLIIQEDVDLEIIVVDNNSKDKTSDIVKKLTKDNKNVHYYLCKKQGVSAARNYGIDKATGEYISFVDSDDYCKPNMFKELYRVAQEKDADIVVCGIEGQDEEGNILPKENSASSYDGKNLVKRYLCEPATPCAKLIRTAYINEYNIRYKEEISLAEDLAFVSELGAYTRNIAFVDGDYYVYVHQRDSLMHHIDSEREYQIFEALGYIYGVFSQKANTISQYHDEIERMFIANLVLAASTRYMLIKGDKGFYGQAQNFLRLHFPKWHLNPYYKNRGLKMKLFFFLYRHNLIMPFRKLITRAKG